MSETAQPAAAAAVVVAAAAGATVMDPSPLLSDRTDGDSGVFNCNDRNGQDFPPAALRVGTSPPIAVSGLTGAEGVKSLGKSIKSLLAHERILLEEGWMFNETHPKASSLWLNAPSTTEIRHEHTLVYRPMGDEEVLYLIANNQLPGSQPYQAVIEGEAGRLYAEKYLDGAKWTNTHPSTVVEFCVPKTLIQTLFAIQHKVEDGALSMGLGNKAGKGLPLFNKCLQDGTGTWRIVRVKRRMSTAAPKRKF